MSKIHSPIILYIFFITTQTLGQGSLDAVYSEGLNAAQSNMQSAATSMQNLNPTETFKDKDGKSYYTETPPQIEHHQGVDYGNAKLLDDAGRGGIDQNEATKAAWKSFGNPKIKIDPSEAWLAKSNDIIKNSSAITTGISSNPGDIVKDGGKAGINCKEAKICRIDLIKKTCNEEANLIKKICEKTPNINIVDEPYQENQSYAGAIPAIHLETKKGRWGNSYEVFDPHKGSFTLPVSGTITSFSANFGSWHMRFGAWLCSNHGGQGAGYLQGVYLSHSAAGPCGKYKEIMAYSNNNLNIPVEAGKPINFRFDGWERGSWSSSHYDLVIKVERKRKVANLESWSETNCSEG